MEAGTSRTYDLASYLQSGVATPKPTIVSVRSQGNSGVRATASGSKLTLTAANVQRILQGLVYVNIHTVNNGGGEIRGQVLRNP